jgi:hypothetical protein
MIKKKKLRNVLIFIFSFFIIDLSLTQLFLFKFYYKKLEKQYASDLENRVLNKDYKYTFKKKSSFKSNYIGHEYTVKTNNLGFRDYEIRDLSKNNYYTIIIGDSFVEGVALEYEDTLVAQLNKKIKNSNIKNYEFLNAGVASYSPYIYQRKVISIIKENPWLKTDRVILLLDKSDVPDEIHYFDPIQRPEYFPIEKAKYNFRYNEDFFDDLKRGDLFRFIKKQTTTGLFLKQIGDFLDLKRRNLRDRYKLSKKLGKSFFKISSKQVRAFRSINTRSHIANYFHGNLWETKGKKSVNISIENIMILKNYLDNKNIELLVVLFPWPFEIANKTPRENYTNYIIQKLVRKGIKYTSVYKHFLKGDIYSNISDNYIYNDLHFNRQGNKILSDIIWKEHLKNFRNH